MKFLFQLATVVLTPLLATAPMRAEISTFQPVPAGQIQLKLIDRETDSAAAGSQSEKGFTVQVTDSAGAPVDQSAVVFRLPDEGASGSFPDGARSAIVYTSADGRARVSGIKWSDAPGIVAIKVTATKGEARTGFLLLETLTAAVSAAAPDPAPIAPAASAPVHKEVKTAAGQPSVQSATPFPQQPGKTRDANELSKAPVVPSPSAPPAVSVVNTRPHEKVYSNGHKKWMILAAVIAAGAAGLAVGAKGKTTASTTAAGTSVGTPSISIGHP